MATSENLRAREGKMEKETLDEKLPGLFEPDTLLPILIGEKAVGE